MNRMKRRYTYRMVALLLALTVLPLCAPSAAPRAHTAVAAEAQGELPAAGQAINPTVRVLLRRLGITDRMDLTLSSAYGLVTQDGAELRLASGSEVSFQLKDGSIYLYYEGLSMSLGAELSLLRYADAEAKEIGFRLTNYPALYIGDLRLTAADGTLRPILSIHVEDYLLGVVPYEMSNFFPIEALKAQAVAARNYVLRKQNAQNDYDVVDTTNDQVFKGYVEGYAQAERAVAETYGVCGFYKGELAQCYYAASNGGQMELVNTVWPTDDDFGYYAFGADEYDVQNPSSVVRTAEWMKSYTNQGADVAPFGLRKLLAAALETRLKELGFDPAPESVRVHTVGNVRIDTPSAENSRLMTMLHMTVTVSGRTRAEGASAAPVQGAAEDWDTEEVTLFASAETAPPTHTPTPVQITPSVSALAFAPVQTVAPSATPTPQPTPSPTPVPVYGAFTRLEGELALDIPIFPTVENALAMNISSNYENEIWSLKEAADRYTLEARRFGHGVGMSQRGAEWMAGAHQKTYREILAFYYPGMELQKIDELDVPLRTASEALSATAGPPPSPTPRPTLMPATMRAGDGQWFALVANIDDDSSLNLRSQPDLSGEILMRLFKNQRLLVLERCQEEGWVRVATDAIEGYVLESYLDAE